MILIMRNLENYSTKYLIFYESSKGELIKNQAK